jgi:hypothetical protein
MKKGLVTLLGLFALLSGFSQENALIERIDSTARIYSTVGIVGCSDWKNEGSEWDYYDGQWRDMNDQWRYEIDQQFFKDLELTVLMKNGEVAAERVHCDSLEKMQFQVGTYEMVVHALSDTVTRLIDSSFFVQSWPMDSLGTRKNEILSDYRFTFKVRRDEDVFLRLVGLNRYSRDGHYSSRGYVYNQDSTLSSGGVFNLTYANSSAGEGVNWYGLELSGTPMILSKNYKWAFAGQFGGEFRYGHVSIPSIGFDRSMYSYMSGIAGFYGRYALKQNGWFRWPFVDIGAKYHLPIIYRRGDRVGNINQARTYLHRWDDLRVFTRVGLDQVSVTAEYNLLASTQNGAHPLPKWTIGFSFPFGGYPG